MVELPSIQPPLVDPSNILLIVLGVIAVAFLAAIDLGKPIANYIRRKKISGLRYRSWATASGYVFGKTRFDQIVCAPSNRNGRHSFCLGGTGCGKTQAFLLPTISHFDGNFLAIDISGDIADVVKCPGSVIFAPCKAKTSLYNVFGMIDGLAGNPQAQREQLEKLAFLLMPETPGADGAALFFNNEGRKILTAAFTAYYYAGWDFTDICRKILSSSYTELFRDIDAQGNEVASMLINGFRGTSDTNTAGCKQAADAAIQTFALNDYIRNTVRRPDGRELAITPATLEDRSVFLQIPEELLDVYAPLLRIIVAQHLAYFASRPIGALPSLMLALDEFPSLGIDATAIVGALQRFRKRNVSIMVVAQSMAALDRIYGPVTRKDMLNNFLYKVVLQSSDADTQLEIAKMLGHKKEKQTTKTSGRGSSSYTEREELVWEIDPEDLGKLNDDLILIHPAGYERLKKAYYYKYQRDRDS